MYGPAIDYQQWHFNRDNEKYAACARSSLVWICCDGDSGYRDDGAWPRSSRARRNAGIWRITVSPTPGGSAVRGRWEGARSPHGLFIERTAALRARVVYARRRQLLRSKRKSPQAHGNTHRSPRSARRLPFIIETWVIAISTGRTRLYKPFSWAINRRSHAAGGRYFE